MSSAVILGLVGGLLVVAFLANRVFGLTRIPDVLVLMMLGVLLGPGLGLVQAGTLAKTTNLLGTLAIILVLFEGGLELDLRDTIKHFPGSFLLATLAYIFSTALVAVIVVKGLSLAWTDGLLVGAALGCTSSTVVLPVLKQLQAEEPVSVTLMLEASWGDVLAVLTVGLLLGMRSQGGAVAQGLAHGLLNQVGIALLFTIPAGILWSRLLRVLSEQRFWQVLTFSIVLVLYAGMEALGANGLIAVLAFGLTLSNFPGVDPDLGLSLPVTQMAESQQALLTFHSELAFLVRTFFFVLIGAVAELGIFREHPLLMAGTLGSLFLARWLAIHSSRWAWRGIAARHRGASSRINFLGDAKGADNRRPGFRDRAAARHRACVRAGIGIRGHPDHECDAGIGQPSGAKISPGSCSSGKYRTRRRSSRVPGYSTAGNSPALCAQRRHARYAGCGRDCVVVRKSF